MPKYKRNIKSWAEEDRPREKLLQKGKSVLTNAELLAILIGGGYRGRNAVDIAKEILNKTNHSINELARMDIKWLMDTKGIGRAKAISIMSALELGNRRLGEGNGVKVKIQNSQDAYNCLKANFMDLAVEEFWILILNKSNVVINKVRISSGGVSGTVADPKVIFKRALEELGCAVILAHNHPSNNLSPSSADISLTNKLRRAGEALDIAVLDHLIVCNEGFYSFADEGILE